jgi:hypothetical protein
MLVQVQSWAPIFLTKEVKVSEILNKKAPIGAFFIFAYLEE